MLREFSHREESWRLIEQRTGRTYYDWVSAPASTATHRDSSVVAGSTPATDGDHRRSPTPLERARAGDVPSGWARRSRRHCRRSASMGRRRLLDRPRTRGRDHPEPGRRGRLRPARYSCAARHRHGAPCPHHPTRLTKPRRTVIANRGRPSGFRAQPLQSLEPSAAVCGERGLARQDPRRGGTVAAPARVGARTPPTVPRRGIRARGTSDRSELHRRTGLPETADSISAWTIPPFRPTRSAVWRAMPARA